jgi:colanic acid/amylovoran biosynthesis glycosyltransferase
MTRIIYLLDKFPCYSETFVFDQIIGMIERGFDVRILAFNRDPSLIPVELEQKYQLKQRCTYLLNEEKSTAAMTKLWLRGKLILGQIWRSSVRKALNKRQFDGFTHNGFLAAVVAKNIGTFKADVVICHFGTTAHLALCLQELGVLAGDIIPVFHGYDLSEQQVLTAHLHGYQRLFERCPRVLAISELWCRKLQYLGCPEEKIVLHRMGVSLTNFDFQLGKSQLTQPLKLLSVARFTEKKGLQYAISAVAELKRQDLAVQYQIIGDGPLRAELEQQISRLNLADTIVLSGIQPPKVVASTLAESDVFILPSITATNGDMEGVPVSLMEAMASGIICLSTQHSGIPELIEHGVSGVLVPEKDAKALAEQLVLLLQHHFSIIQIRQNARTKIEAEFNQQVLYDQLAKLCRDLTHGQH